MDTNTAAQNQPAKTSIGFSMKFAPIAVVLLLLTLVPALHLARDASLNFLLHFLLIMFMHVALASSWNILGGYAGYISLGHNVFFAIGGYFSGVLLLRYDISVFLSAPIAGLVAMLFALIVGFITLRVRGPSFIIATVALVLMVRIVLDNWDFVGGVGGLYFPRLFETATYAKIPFYYGMLVIAVGAVYMSYRLKHSKLGLGLRAISQDEIKAEVAGIPTSMYKILAFALSGFFIGAAGSIYGHYLTSIRPNTFLLVLVGAQMVLMCILGGKGTVAGPVVGAVLIMVINETVLSSGFGSSELNLFVTGLLMLTVLLFFPDGIVGSLRKMGRLPAFLDWD